MCVVVLIWQNLLYYRLKHLSGARPQYVRGQESGMLALRWRGPKPCHWSWAREVDWRGS